MIQCNISTKLKEVIVMREVLFAIMIILSFMVNALGAESAPTDQGATNATPVQNATKGATNAPPNSTIMLFLVVLILALFAATPLMYNMYKAHQHLQRTDDSLSEFLRNHKDDLDDDKALQIIKEFLNADPGGAPGTARGTMALTVILIVGICLFFLLTYPPSESSELVKDVVLALTGALTAIIGFYFGGNGSTEVRTPEPNTLERKPPESPEPKKGLYLIKENVSHDGKQYLKDTKVDLTSIPKDVLEEWIRTKKVEMI
jgi:hypothetical protein